MQQPAVSRGGPNGGGTEAVGPQAAPAVAAGAAEGLSQEGAAAVLLLQTLVLEHQLAGSGSPPPLLVMSVVATLAAQSAQAVLDALLCLRRRSPTLAAHLLLHSLGPAGWELLSGCMERRQEELAEAGEQRGLPACRAGSVLFVQCMAAQAAVACTRGLFQQCPSRRCPGAAPAPDQRPCPALRTGGATAAEEAVGAVCEELYSAVPDRGALLEAILTAKGAFSRQALREVLDAELAGCL